MDADKVLDAEDCRAASRRAKEALLGLLHEFRVLHLRVVM